LSARAQPFEVTTTYHVLVVDDDEMLVQMIKHMLSDAPFRTVVSSAGNGKDALAALRRVKPHAMILDLLLPEMSGQELLKVLNDDPAFRDFPVLVNSTAVDHVWTRDNIRSCTNLRIDIVARPSSSDVLLAQLQALLGLPNA
jgi:DNA-binding response OmpR family regulator